MEIHTNTKDNIDTRLLGNKAAFFINCNDRDMLNCCLFASFGGFFKNAIITRNFFGG
jgi:hypothetical protein